MEVQQMKAQAKEEKARKHVGFSQLWYCSLLVNAVLCRRKETD